MSKYKVGDQIICDDCMDDCMQKYNDMPKLMHKKNNFVYEGLRQCIFPWGYAVKTSSTWSYYISSMKFTECTGIKVQLEMGV